MEANFRTRLLAGLMLLAVCGLGLLAPPTSMRAAKGGSGGFTPLTSVVDDGFPNMVRSDGKGPGAMPNLYEDGVDCVQSQASATGWAGLRTVADNDLCRVLTWPERRFLTLDFHTGSIANCDPVSQDCSFNIDLDLEPNDTDPLVEKVPAQVVAGAPFDKNATSAVVLIHVLETLADGTTTVFAPWTVKYKNQAPIQRNPDGSVEIFLGQMGAPAATADLNEHIRTVDPKSGKVRIIHVYRGTFDMPLHIKFAKK